MDPGTGLAILGTAAGSAKVVEKILGPTADYIGEGLQNWTEKRINNVGRIFQKAQAKLGDKTEGPGSVPPKVLKGILSEGAYCDYELGAEYFGGVLASSRTEVGRDDRGSVFTSLLSRLSAYQIRSHYFFYTTLRVLYKGYNFNIAHSDGRNSMDTYIPMTSYITAMEFGQGEDVNNMLVHSMFGLERESLITRFQFGGLEHIRKRYKKADQPGLIFSPTALGAELFLWAHGRGDLGLNSMLDAGVDLDSGVLITIAPGIHSVNNEGIGYPKHQADAA